MLGLQLAAVVMGLAALAFFAVFGGYYFRNRRMAMEARRRQLEEEGATRRESASRTSRATTNVWGEIG